MKIITTSFQTPIVDIILKEKDNQFYIHLKVLSKEHNYKVGIYVDNTILPLLDSNMFTLLKEFIQHCNNGNNVSEFDNEDVSDMLVSVAANGIDKGDFIANLNTLITKVQTFDYSSISVQKENVETVTMLKGLENELYYKLRLGKNYYNNRTPNNPISGKFGELKLTNTFVNELLYVLSHQKRVQQNWGVNIAIPNNCDYNEVIFFMQQNNLTMNAHFVNTVSDMFSTVLTYKI